ncbi:MAG: long-chain fatty acid--CoA ligase, partial [Alphaproteobacteria bacterium]|nr:long-chain fatty acid--CoA ligase [Alphaproteobacteria bacterium]
LTVLPMFHVGGLNILTSPAFYAGGTVILHRRFEPGAVLRAIVEERPTQLVLVPATIQAVIDLPGWAEADLSSLRLLTTGSSVVPLHLIDAVQARGVPVCQTYGLTETAPVSIYQKPGDGLRKPRSTGKCGLHCEMKIADDDGNEVPVGASGEILIRGGNVLREYWNNEEETHRALKHGWFHTGDVAWRDEEGDVFVIDRKKDIVISGGENIYPAEIEQLVHRMDDVADVAVVGRGDARWGEVPVAVVVPAPGARIAASDFLARFEGRLARFKHPKEVLFVDALPRTALGKTRKHELREWLRRS